MYNRRNMPALGENERVFKNGFSHMIEANDEVRMPHVLITGGAGYIGSTIVPMLLEQGYKVTVYDIFTWGFQSLLSYAGNKNLHIVKGDILDKEHLASVLTDDVDTVIHLAAIVGFPACDRDPEYATAVNETGTKNVVDLLKKDQNLVYSSSGSCYGAIEGICSEDTPINPLTVYSCSKANGEKVALSAGGVGLRLATLFGVSPRLRLDLLINDLTATALRNKHIDLYEGHFRRTFLHVKDAARAFVFTVQNIEKMAGQVYNVGSESMNISKREVVRLIQNKVKNCTVREDAEGKDKDKRDYAVSYAKLRALGFKATTSVQDGLDELIKVIPCLNEYEKQLSRNVSE